MGQRGAQCGIRTQQAGFVGCKYIHPQGDAIKIRLKPFCLGQLNIGQIPLFQLQHHGFFAKRQTVQFSGLKFDKARLLLKQNINQCHGHITFIGQVAVQVLCCVSVRHNQFPQLEPRGTWRQLFLAKQLASTFNHLGCNSLGIDLKFTIADSLFDLGHFFSIERSTSSA